MSINNNKIDINGDLYTRSDFNGVSIIIHDKDGYINATKIAKDNNKQKHLERYLKSDKWNEISNSWLKISLPQKRGGLVNKSELIYIITTGTQEIYGTYVHPELIHFVAEWCNIEYAFKVCVIMNEINKLKELKNKDGKDNLQNIINELKHKNEKLQQEINNRDNIISQKDDKIDELTKLINDIRERSIKADDKLDKVINQNEGLKQQNDELNNKVDNLSNSNEQLLNVMSNINERITSSNSPKMVECMLYEPIDSPEIDKNNNRYI